MEKLIIAGRAIGPGEPPWVIAEIGANHNGDMGLCRRIIDAAKEVGADAVKFQSWSKQSLISRPEYERNTRYAKADPSQLTLEQAVEKYQFTPDQHREIAAYCRRREILFFSSAFSKSEVDLLESLDVPAYKIASMDVNFLPLLDVVAATRKPVLLSTGMATLGEIETALRRLRDGAAGPIALLHCVSIYPCPPEAVNLRNIPMLQETFDVPVGFSDHTAGVPVALAAVALGACILEKHFTVDKKLEGWDHAISADPEDLAQIVGGSRTVFEALGRRERVVGAAETEKRKVFRRRAVARRPLRKGQKITEQDLDFKRPGNGIPPDRIEAVVGRTLVRDIGAEEEIEWADLA